MLLNKCPNAIQVYDEIFDIETNARLWLNISLQLSKLNTSDANYSFKVVDILLSSVKNKQAIKEQYNKKLIDKLYWFLNLGKTNEELKEEADKSTRGNGEKLYSFEKDETLIFSAFYRTYKIDIEKELDTLHWWKFMSMFNDLDEHTKFVSVYMYYRGMDTSESVIYKNANEKEKQRILEMKRFVSLGYEEVKGSVSESEIEKIRQARLKLLEDKR